MGNVVVVMRGVEYECVVTPDGVITIQGHGGPIDIQPCGRDTFSVLVDGESTQVTATGAGSEYQVLLANNQVDVHVETARDRLIRKHAPSPVGAHRRYEIHAPMPALVVRVEVAEGDHVKEGQGLLVLEAMKMENEIKSHQEGRVKEIHVKKGKPVEKGELLMLLE